MTQILRQPLARSGMIVGCKRSASFSEHQQLWDFELTAHASTTSPSLCIFAPCMHPVHKRVHAVFARVHTSLPDVYRQFRFLIFTQKIIVNILNQDAASSSVLELHRETCCHGNWIWHMEEPRACKSCVAVVMSFLRMKKYIWHEECELWGQEVKCDYCHNNKKQTQKVYTECWMLVFEKWLMVQNWLLNCLLNVYTKNMKLFLISHYRAANCARLKTFLCWQHCTDDTFSMVDFDDSISAWGPAQKGTTPGPKREKRK